jgi:subtilase family serine protease
MLVVPKISARPGLRAVAALPTALALAGAFAIAGPAATASAATVTVAGSHPDWAAASADRGAVASATTVDTTVYLAGKDPAGLNAFAAEVSDPSSANYQKYLTPAQFTARYGATPAQVASVEAWLRSSGLTVTSVSQHSITARGTAAATEKAYGTKLDEFAVKGQNFRAPTGDARVPSSVGGAVLAVTGLSNMPERVKPASLVGQVTTPSIPGVSGAKATQTKGSDGATFLGPTSCSTYYGQLKDKTDPAFNGKSDNPYAVCGYVPSQLRGAYGVTGTGLTGKGVTVAIVDAYGSPTMQADADQYAVNHGDKPFAKGQYTETVTPAQWTSEAACQGPAGWAGEESLDVESVHSMAPGADVHYYGANSCNDPDFLADFTSIVDTHSADLVSDSWGGVIYSSTGNEDPSVLAEYTQIFEQGAAEGIGFNFSAGDCGAEDPSTACGSNDTSTTPQADFPTSDVFATSVGGTSLAIGKNNNAEWNTVWGTDAWTLSASKTWQSAGWQYGGGGGTSAQFAQPWYQKGVVPTKLAKTLPDGVTVDSAMRVAPDVSMDADPTTGFLFGMTQPLPNGGTGYAESAIGGTSLACPLFVGLQADAMQSQGGRPIGFANPAIYRAAGTKAYTDVTAGGAGAKAVNLLPAYNGYPAIVFNFGDDGLLKATKGYDDATGVGTPSPAYLWLRARW